jgi:2-keto-4-pentenoate hydratase
MNYAELDPARREPLREGVEKLLAARREAEPIAELPAGLRPATELEAEYMQDVMASLLGEIGGWKVGLPGPGGTPHFCPMPAVGIFARSPAILRGQSYRTRAVEGEIAFRLKSDLCGPGVTEADVLAASECVMACFEIVDSRIHDWRIRIQDTVADNASCGVFVLGTREHDPRELDLPNLRMRVFKNGAPLSEGLGSAVQGNPLTAVAWLANTLGAFGIPFKAGEIILSGSLVPLEPVAAGDRFELDIDGLGSARVSFRA